MSKHLSENQEIVRLNSNHLPKTDSIISWILFFVSPYRKSLNRFFIFRLFRYTYFALLPTVLGFYVDKLQTGEFAKHSDFYTNSGILFLFGYTLLLVNSWVFKRELVLTENATRSLSLLGMTILNSLPIEWHANYSTGKKLELIMDARKALLEILRIIRWQAMPILANMLGIAISLFVFKGPAYFVLIFVSFAFLYLYFSWKLDLPLPKLYDKYKDSYSKLISKLYEFSSSILTVKSLALAPFIEKKAFSLEISSQEAKNKIYTVVFRRWIVINFIAGVALALICILAMKEALEGRISTGAFAGVVMLFYSLWVTLEGISVQQDQIHEYLSAIRRFIKLCRDFESRPQSQDKQKLKANWTKIEFDKVSFKYPDTINSALSEVSLEIRSGQVVALVGPSGSGKSTLIKLILGLYASDTGSIKVDGVDFSLHDSEDWLQHLAFVPQEIELFDASIRDNILLNREAIDPERYQAVLHEACLDDFVGALPAGDQTLVGERGLKLSGGQKQRIGVARALLRDSDFILLDEATSSLDSITENQIQNTLFKNLKGKTLIIIAHRLSTVRTADQIIVLNEGRVEDVGVFSELLKRDGLFSEMWGIQGLVGVA